MKREKITLENMDFYGGLDPFELLPRVGLYGHTGVGLREGDTPVGVLILDHEKDTLFIEWMYIAGGYRCRGLGEELLELSYSLALSCGLTEVSALIPGYRGRQQICPIERGYLMDRYLDKTVSYAPEWRLTLMDIGRSKRVSDAIKSEASGEFATLASFSAGDRHRVIDMLKDDPDVSMLYPIQKDSLIIDDDISVLCRENKKLAGAAIFATAGDDIYLIAFTAVKKNAAEAVLLKALQAANKKYPKDTTINICFKEEGYEDVYEALLGAGIGVSALVADPKAFLADQLYESANYDFIDAMISGVA